MAALDRAVHGSRDGAEIARIKIWHSDRDLLYTADPHTATPRNPSTAPSHELEEALDGEIEAEIISSSEEPDNAALLERYGTLLDVYVPILYGDDPEPAGVFELSLPYQPVQASIRADTTRAIALLFAGLVVLWLGELVLEMAPRLSALAGPDDLVALDAHAGVSVHPADAADGPALLRKPADEPVLGTAVSVSTGRGEGSDRVV